MISTSTLTFGQSGLVFNPDNGYNVNYDLVDTIITDSNPDGQTASVFNSYHIIKCKENISSVSFSTLLSFDLPP
jgi:hypothetical protein